MTVQEAQDNYAAIAVAIRGYIRDSKAFGFKPTELPQMQDKAQKAMDLMTGLSKI